MHQIKILVLILNAVKLYVMNSFINKKGCFPFVFHIWFNNQKTLIHVHSSQFRYVILAW